MLDNLFEPKSIQQVLAVIALLAGTVIAGLVGMQWFQAWVRRTQREDPQSGRGDWESALAGYKNLRDQGVLSDEEYRKIRTLAEPHLQWPPLRTPDLPMGRGPAGAGVPDRPGGD